ncbi:CAP domain-containing protein [Emticicia sp. C21]|uniref:CAP domain-containing protein n=1 Tax=Emticicia sp. C21 TaxID=2302915 RepID=UPI001E2FEA32|nr:CAP domain-containing protein [Emticicia sp. C21]
MKTKRIILLQLLGILLIGYLTPSCAQSPTSDEDFSVMEQEILQEVNTYRASKRLKPLQMVELITDAATKHSKDMGRGRVPFGHDGFDNRMDKVMRKIDNANACAENVAFGKFTAKEVVKRWIQSPGHKKNIEGNYNLTGIGVVRGKDGYPYFTQIFINQRAM